MVVCAHGWEANEMEIEIRLRDDKTYRYEVYATFKADNFCFSSQPGDFWSMPADHGVATPVFYNERLKAFRPYAAPILPDGWVIDTVNVFPTSAMLYCHTSEVL